MKMGQDKRPKHITGVLPSAKHFLGVDGDSDHIENLLCGLIALPWHIHMCQDPQRLMSILDMDQNGRISWPGFHRGLDGWFITSHDMGCLNGATWTWMVHNGKTHWNGWLLGVPPILGNLHWVICLIHSEQLQRPHFDHCPQKTLATLRYTEFLAAATGLRSSLMLLDWGYSAGYVW